jgi:hypothetical protein
VFLVFLAELVVEIGDGVYLPVEENVVLEVFHRRGSVGTTEVQAHVALLFDVFVLLVVFGLAETLHERLEAGPVPVGMGNHLFSHSLRDGLGRSCALKISPGTIIIQIVCTLDPLAKGVKLFVLDFSIDKDAPIRIPPEALVSKHTLVLLIEERHTLVVSQNVGQIGLNDVALTSIGQVESSHSEV